MKYAIGIPSNENLQRDIEELLERPVEWSSRRKRRGNCTR